MNFIFRGHAIVKSSLEVLFFENVPLHFLAKNIQTFKNFSIVLKNFVFGEIHFSGGGGAIRTLERETLTDLQSASFSHLDTPPKSHIN